ncbi:MAG: pilus assembly protein PilM [Pirellulales bacterium]|nr:pilus assembly protein PilM [Pirellulales bacterium]
MVGWIKRRRPSPIGVDLGSRSIKLLQFDAERARIREAVRWELPAGEPGDRADHVAAALRQAREGRNFRGRDAVLCLGSSDLFVQNIRVPQAAGDELRETVRAEAAARLPFDTRQTELRFIEADTVRQGDAFRREVILMAGQRAAIENLVDVAVEAGLVPLAIDVEPAAMLRCYARQYRRDTDQQMRAMFVNLGASNTTVVISRGSDPMFIKHVDFGGRLLDEAVARHLKMKLADAVSLRRHNGDRRADQRDPEVARSVMESIRPLMERLAGELAMCIRYHSVTFRGQPLARVVLSGGEASASLAEWLQKRLDTTCEVGNPLRTFEKSALPGRVGQWDVAAGLALREAAP